MNSVRTTVPIIFGILILTGLSGFQFAPITVQSAEAELAPIAGWRSSQYGDYTKWGHDQSDPTYWISIAEQMSSKFPGFAPGGILVVGEIDGHPGTATSTWLPFPNPGGDYPNVTFSSTDTIEPLLDAYDDAGLKVYLQVESADADIPMLMDLIMDRYGHHTSVIGFGVDVEWYHEKDFPGWGRALTDGEVSAWATQVKSFNPNYGLMVKHWDPSYLSDARPDNVLFLTDSQGFSSLSAATDEYIAWIDHFGNSQVGFQIGYPTDMTWWDNLNDPASEIMNAVISERSNANIGAIFWVDFSVLKAFPENGNNSPPVANDQDVQLTGSSVVIRLDGNDSDGNPLTFSIVSNPNGGRLSKITTLNDTTVDVTYTVKRNFSGMDSFEFLVNDGTDNSNIATVTIYEEISANTPPVANDDSGSVNQSGTVNVNLASNDSDNDDGLDLASIQIISGPSNGSVIVNADGTVDYTHNGSETTGDSFTYTIKDNSAATSNVATVNISINGPILETVVHLGALLGEPSTKGPWNIGTVTITVHNSVDGPISDVLVSGEWSGFFTGTASCTTNSLGTCTVSDRMKNGSGTATFEVKSMSGSGISYDSESNDTPEDFVSFSVP